MVKLVSLLCPYKGYGGGISIAEGYKIDKTILIQKELSAIFMGLKSIDSISKYTYTQSLMEKLTYKKSAILSDQNGIIDLASFYSTIILKKEKANVLSSLISLYLGGLHGMFTGIVLPNKVIDFSN